MRVKVLRYWKSSVVPQSHLVAPTMAPGNRSMCVSVHTCRTCCLLQVFCASTAGCSLRVLIPSIISSWGFARGCIWDGSVDVSGTLLEDMKQHRSVVIIVLYQSENVSKECEPVPSHWQRPPWLSDPPDTGPGGFWWLQPSTSGMLVVLFCSVCSRFSSYIVSPQYGPACGLGLPNGHAGEDSVFTILS